MGTTMQPQRWKYVLLVILHNLFLFSHAQNLQGPNGSGKISDGVSSPGGVKLIQSPDAKMVTMFNGILNVTLSVPAGDVQELMYKESTNLLDTKEEERGRWNIVWNGLDNKDKVFDGLQATNYTVIEQNENYVEISFSITTWENGSPKVPLNVDKRFVMLKDCPGFYTYAIFENPPGRPAFGVQVGRLVFKLGPMFDFLAVSDIKQRYMPTAEDRKTGKVLDYKEAVLLTNPANPEFRGEVDDKYFYACPNKISLVHGWVSNDAVPIGFWMITPSNEFRAGGPLKQDLTSHCGTTSLSVFTSRHYVGDDIDLKFEAGQTWKKVIGPQFIYLNSDPTAKADPSLLWNDAKKRLETEAASWPYKFPISKDYLKADQRGSVSGKLLVTERLNKTQEPAAASAHVGLATPGPPGSWQIESKGYQFWTETDVSGGFSIKNVLPGKYGLFAWVNGTVGEYVHTTEINITPGSAIDLGNVVFEAPRNGTTLWEIGTADRTSLEFFFPEPLPEYKIHKFKTYIDKLKQYGLWKRYPELYPKNDLVFTAGKSDYTKDWFYAQVTRENGPKSYLPTTWTVEFNLDRVEQGKIYTLQLALAAASGTDLEVRFNDPNSPPLFTVTSQGKENVVARYGDHGIYHYNCISVDSKVLVQGLNKLFLSQTKAGQFTSVTYDYIRFEGPPPV